MKKCKYCNLLFTRNHHCTGLRGQLVDFDDITNFIIAETIIGVDAAQPESDTTTTTDNSDFSGGGGSFGGRGSDGNW